MKNCEVVNVVSSVIDKVGYNPEDRFLVVEFKGGKQYLYEDVPKDEFDALVNAESVGIYFAEEIKDEYECTEL